MWEVHYYSQTVKYIEVYLSLYDGYGDFIQFFSLVIVLTVSLSMFLCYQCELIYSSCFECFNHFEFKR
jgi:hypothetical protein